MSSQSLDLARCVYELIRPYSKATVSYSDVCGQLTGRWAGLDPDSALLAEALGNIVERCRNKNLPALSAVVVHKSGDKMPGNGYFVAAHGNIGDPILRQVAWATELGQVRKATYPPHLDAL